MRLLAATRYILRVWLRAKQSPKPLVRGAAHQGFKPKPDGLRVRGRATGRLRLFEEIVVDMKGLLHTYNHAINIWSIEPDRETGGFGAGKVRSHTVSPRFIRVQSR